MIREGRPDTAPAGRVVRVEDALPGEARVLEAAERSLTGRRRGVAALTPFLGPAFIAAVAYVDPGNFATNIAAGAKFGYALLWVVLAANLMAMIVQSLSAKLGIATGQNLAEVCRDRFPRRVTYFLWIQAEAIAMATDLAEFTGAALGLVDPLLVAALPVGADHRGGRVRCACAPGTRLETWGGGDHGARGSDRCRVRNRGPPGPGLRVGRRPRGVRADASELARRRFWPSGSSARRSCRT